MVGNGRVTTWVVIWVCLSVHTKFANARIVRDGRAERNALCAAGVLCLLDPLCKLSFYMLLRRW